MNLDFFKILGVKVSVLDLNKAFKYIDFLITQKKRAYVCVAPVSTIVDCQRDAEYRKVVNGADMVTPDGMPLVWFAKRAGYAQIKRTYGPDLMDLTCDLGQEKGYRHYFYGGAPETVEALEKILKKKYPKLNIVGKYSPPFRAKAQIEDKKIIDDINRADPDVLWVGLGAPKQDYWMVKNRELFNAPVMVGIGAAFDFLSGKKSQAPKWMQKSGLEWFFRLCCEPKRLWKRYCIGNSLFIFYLFKSLFIKNYAKKN